LSSEHNRRQQERLGRFAETLAAWCLRLSGYRIAAHRTKTPFGEIDIITISKDVATIVEVKARKDLAAGILAFSPRQRRRIEQAASWLTSRRPDLARRRLRFDIVVVRPWRWPHHRLDAWRPD
jgi:putative endonuclease